MPTKKAKAKTWMPSPQHPAGNPPGEPQLEPVENPVGELMGPTHVLLFDPVTFDPEWRDPRVRLYRENDRTKKLEFHGYLSLDEASEALVAELFGGGRWTAQVVAGDDRGQQAIRRACRFSIPGLYRPPSKTLPGVGPGTAPGVPQAIAAEASPTNFATPNESLNAALVGSVIELLKAQREGSGRSAVGEWVPVLVPLASGLMTLLAKMSERKSDTPTDVLIELERLRSELANLKDRPGPATTAVADALEGIERIVNLTRKVKRLSGSDEESPIPADPESAMWGMASKLMDHLGAKGAPTGASSAPVPTPPPAALPAMPIPSRPMWEQILLGNKARLLDSAMRGVSPELVADVAVQFAPANVIGVLTEFVQRPDMVSVAMQVLPELQQFPAWTEQFFVALRSTILGDEDQESEEGPTP